MRAAWYIQQWCFHARTCRAWPATWHYQRLVPSTATSVKQGAFHGKSWPRITICADFGLRACPTTSNASMGAYTSDHMGDEGMGPRAGTTNVGGAGSGFVGQQCPSVRGVGAYARDRYG